MNIAILTTSFRVKLIEGAYQNWLKKGGKVLDIGTGNGIVSQALKHTFEAEPTMPAKITDMALNKLHYKTLMYL